MNNLTIAFGKNRVVDGVSFNIKKGEILALVGESGSGKTLTSRAMLDLLPDGATCSGDISFNSAPIAGQLAQLRGGDVGMIFQEPMSSLNPLHTIGRQLREAITLHQNISNDALEARVNELLEAVELDALIDRQNAYPYELSGGQRQRVMIAMALANDPKLLIADEPTTALDVTVQAEILALLKRLRKDFGMAILLITHDLTIVQKMADRVAVMQQGNLVETATTKTLFSKPKHAYTKMLLDAAPSGRPIRTKKGAKHVVKASSVKVWFAKKKSFFGTVRQWVKAVNGVSIGVKAGHTLGIVGESGSGKTTLAMALLRLVKSEGKIAFLGSDVRAPNRKEMRTLRRQMQLVFQDPFSSLNPRLSVGEVILEGLRAHFPDESKEWMEARVIAALEDVQLEPETRHAYPHEFSGGQRQRIALARALVLEPALIVLDEPTSALDLSTQSHMLDLLKKLQREKGLTYLFITHDLRVIRTIAHDIIVMKDGKIVESGTNAEVFRKPKKPYTKRLINAALVG